MGNFNFQTFTSLRTVMAVKIFDVRSGGGRRLVVPEENGKPGEAVEVEYDFMRKLNPKAGDYIVSDGVGIVAVPGKAFEALFKSGLNFLPSELLILKNRAEIAAFNEGCEAIKEKLKELAGIASDIFGLLSNPIETAGETEAAPAETDENSPAEEPKSETEAPAGDIPEEAA